MMYLMKLLIFLILFPNKTVIIHLKDNSLHLYKDDKPVHFIIK